MKFKTYLETITGVGVYPLVSLLIFFVFFMALLVYVFKLDKKTLDRMKNTPLEDGSFKKGVLTIVMLGFGFTAFGQDAGSKPLGNEELILYVILTFLGVVTLFLAIFLFRAFDILYRINNPEIKNGEAGVHWWDRFSGTAVAVKDEKKILIEEHDYDGIQELDNPMPPWLQFLFIGTIIFAIIYSFYYFGGFGRDQMGELEHELAVAKKQHEKYLAKAGASMDENSVTVLADAQGIAQGKVIYETNCAACHGMAGEGSVGPNLTDQYWLHGGSINDVFKVIKYGVPEKGMISWEKQLPPLEIQKVSSYILTLVGTNPANAKEPQGELYEAVGGAEVAETIVE